MSQQNVEIVRRGYQLCEAGDLEGVAALFDDEATIPDAGGLGLTGTAAGSRSGPEGFLRASEDALEAFDDYRVEAEQFIDAGDAVVVAVRITGRGRVSSAALEQRVAHLWRPRDGKVISGEVYRTADEAREAVGRRGR